MQVVSWTQERLEEASGVSRPVIAHLERQARNPTLDTLERLAAASDIPLDRLLSERGPGRRRSAARQKSLA